jgi:hypothetical protein
VDVVNGSGRSSVSSGSRKNGGKWRTGTATKHKTTTQNAARSIYASVHWGVPQDLLVEKCAKTQEGNEKRAVGGGLSLNA